MTPEAAAALTDIKGYASANRIVYAHHARERMSQRNVRHVDVRLS